MDQNDRIIVLIDMDCFYVQCEQRLQPDKWSKPCVVAQYNNWKSGGIIAVNYEARPFGIKRGMRGDDAKTLCPDLHIFKVPDDNGKAKLDRYRDASVEVFNVIKDFIATEEKDLGQNLVILERASVDEAFIDFTKLIDAKQLMLPELEDLKASNTKIEMNGIELDEWYEKLTSSIVMDDARLVMGAILTGKLRQLIFEKTQFRCSAGISHNKMLCKLACGINKPNAQTILPMLGVPTLFETIDISDVRFLGGKLGRQVKQMFSITTMKQLNQIDQDLLANTFDDKTARWLYDLSRGLDDEPVSDRRTTKSIGCGKNFRGPNALKKLKDIDHWVKVLLTELYARMVQDKQINKRLAKLLVVGYFTNERGHCSRSVQIDVNSGDYPKPEKIAVEIMKQVFQNQSQINVDPILNISIAATKFVDETPGSEKIDRFFQKIDKISYMQRQNEANNPCSKKIMFNTIEKYFHIQTDTWEDDHQKINPPEGIINFNIDDDPVAEKMDDDFNLLMNTFFFQKLLIMCEDDETFDMSEDDDHDSDLGDYF